MEIDCIFCKIASGAMGVPPVYEDEEVFAFGDIAPVAPVHILIVPKRHIQSAHELTETDAALLGKMFSAARKIAGETGIDETGYRLATNIGPDGGQSVPHLHLHLIGGRKLKWEH
ncbi:MAG: histidine triad nucleotide-binding protein [Clostridiales bacterium]|nr:histidine triad nucleotide-binding protein [Clostridiales bacterium]